MRMLQRDRFHRLGDRIKRTISVVPMEEERHSVVAFYIVHFLAECTSLKQQKQC
jgi:hypothetical protein